MCNDLREIVNFRMDRGYFKITASCRCVVKPSLSWQEPFHLQWGYWVRKDDFRRCRETPPFITDFLLGVQLLLPDRLRTARWAKLNVRKTKWDNHRKFVARMRKSSATVNDLIDAIGPRITPGQWAVLHDALLDAGQDRLVKRVKYKG